VVAAEGESDMKDTCSLGLLADLYSFVFKMLGKELPSVESFCTKMNAIPQNETFVGIYRKLTSQETDILYYEYALSVSLADIIKNDMKRSAKYAVDIPGGLYTLFLAKHLSGSGAALVVALVIDEFNAAGFRQDCFLIPLLVEGALCWCVVNVNSKEQSADILKQPFNADTVQNFDLGAWVPGSMKAN
jgi:hypothetical protein